MRELNFLGIKTTIGTMKAIFSTRGIPDLIISDNSPPFSSKEFLDFARNCGFTHVTSSLRYPRANGEADCGDSQEDDGK